jgi:sorting nexin-1/2
MRNELQRFEKEKVEDFKSGVETFLESAVEAQKEVSFTELLKLLTRFTDSLTVDRVVGDVPLAVGCW